jgi:hypothetical protein
MFVVGMGFSHLASLFENKGIKFIIILVSIFCIWYWPYCIWKFTDNYFDKILERDQYLKDTQRKKD